jgi:hypothetical protein
VHWRTSKLVIGWPPVLVGSDHVSVTAGTPEPRLSADTVARRLTGAAGALNAVVLTADCGLAPFAFTATT